MVASEKPFKVSVFNNGIIAIYEEVKTENGVFWKEPHEIRLVQQGQQQGFALFPLMFHSDDTLLSPPDASKILFSYNAGADASKNYLNALEKFRLQKSGLIAAPGASEIRLIDGKKTKK